MYKKAKQMWRKDITRLAGKKNGVVIKGNRLKQKLELGKKRIDFEKLEGWNKIGRQAQ